MESLFKDYKKYKWFFSLSEKLIIGGKSAAQNDELLRYLKSLNKEFIIMHTSEPGSPFSVIVSEFANVTKKDIEECAIFTASFSRAWRSGKKKASVDIFSSSDIYKSNSMEQGTWGVKGLVKHLNVELKLVLTRQKGILRAVPEKTLKDKKEELLIIAPGKINKSELLPKLSLELEGFSQEEIISALPSGGLKIIKK